MPKHTTVGCRLMWLNWSASCSNEMCNTQTHTALLDMEPIHELYGHKFVKIY